MYKGSFVVVEGPDGSGKSTLAKDLMGEFQAQGFKLWTGPIDEMPDNGRFVIHLRQPGGTPFAEKIRELLLSGPENDGESYSKEVQYLLFSAARVQLMNDLIIPAVNKQCVVICERHTLSSVVYQNISLSQINNLLGIKPTVTVLASAPADVCLQRIRARHDGDYFENKSDDDIAKIHRRYETHCDLVPTGRLFKVDTGADSTNNVDYDSSILEIVACVTHAISFNEAMSQNIDGRELERQVADIEKVRLIIRGDVDNLRVPPYPKQPMSDNTTYGELMRNFRAILGSVPFCVEVAKRDVTETDKLGTLRMTNIPPVMMMAVEA